jgi:hypothetical protein
MFELPKASLIQILSGLPENRKKVVRRMAFSFVETGKGLVRSWVLPFTCVWSPCNSGS